MPVENTNNFGKDSQEPSLGTNSKDVERCATQSLTTSAFDYHLPEKNIAQSPMVPRDACKLLCLDKYSGAIKDAIFTDIENMLHPGDLIVANETRVRPARLLGHKAETGGAAEVFLLRPALGAFASKQSDTNSSYWEALVRPGKRLKPGSLVEFCDSAGNLVLEVEIADYLAHDVNGQRIVRLRSATNSTIDEAIHAVGNTPLPPYIKDYTGDKELYQTVYSAREASAAAPTAGLHFTPELISRLKNAGIGWECVELEVGIDTFRVVEEENFLKHKMHTETYSVPEKTAKAIAHTKANGGRVIAVGTTSVRSLESAWNIQTAHVQACEGKSTSIFIYPGYEFQVVDALITNFHVPRSTLMMLVSALAGVENIMKAYTHAIEMDYRMLSFGDAMFIS